MTWQKLLHHISIAKWTSRMVTPQDFADAVENFSFPPSPKAYVKGTLYATVDFVCNGISNRSSVAFPYLKIPFSSNTQG